MLKRTPNKGRDMLLYMNNFVKYLPIDKNSMDMLSPIIDFTNSNENSFMETFNGIDNERTNDSPGFFSEQKKPSNKRSVSETKKKYVAANQDWKCGHCNNRLDHTFEIDHKVRLEYGGGNDVTNLVALCRNCHGKKTASENM